MTKEEIQIAQLSTARFSNFVSPENCEMLTQYGIKLNQPLHYWMVINGHAHIRSYLYDYDNYYSDADKMIDAVRKPIRLTAFTIGVLEQVLPPYTICKTNFNQYELMVDRVYLTSEVCAPRLADAVALMLIELLKLRRLTPDTINEILNNNV